MNNISFKDLTAQELDDFNEFISCAISYQLQSQMDWMVKPGFDQTTKDRMMKYHGRLADSFEKIVAKMEVST